MPNAAERVVFRDPKEYKPGDIVIPAERIAERVEEMAQDIAQDYKDKYPLLVTVLNGSIVFYADLIRALYRAGLTDPDIDSIGYSSYEKDSQNPTFPKRVKDVSETVLGRDVVVVDDILDRGTTLKGTHDLFSRHGARSIKTAVLLDKPKGREVPFEAEYVGYTIPKLWVEGYGMDTLGRGRSNPNIIFSSDTYHPPRR